VVGKDTLFPTVPNFEFVNQDNMPINNKTFDGKIYVADFIFLSCPSICPKMTIEVKKVYDEYKLNPNVLFISHTIDPENDSIVRLKEYSDNLEVDNKKWFFVTGNKDSIYSLAENGYFATAYVDTTAPGGFVHSGGLLLIDNLRHIRGVYDGTDPKDTERLKLDIKRLLAELDL
jgi:protein SCO1/2